jgi:hypothetical protein
MIIGRSVCQYFHNFLCVLVLCFVCWSGIPARRRYTLRVTPETLSILICRWCSASYAGQTIYTLQPQNTEVSLLLRENRPLSVSIEYFLQGRREPTTGPGIKWWFVNTAPVPLEIADDKQYMSPPCPPLAGLDFLSHKRLWHLDNFDDFKILSSCSLLIVSFDVVRDLKLRIHEQYFCCDGYAMGDNSIALLSHKVATPAIFHLQYMSS